MGNGILQIYDHFGEHGSLYIRELKFFEIFLVKCFT
jgi:hypothetical protein